MTVDQFLLISNAIHKEPRVRRPSFVETALGYGTWRSLQSLTRALTRTLRLALVGVARSG